MPVATPSPASINAYRGSSFLPSPSTQGGFVQPQEGDVAARKRAVATFAEDALDPKIMCQNVSRGALQGRQRTRMDGMQVFEISARGAYQPSFKTRLLDPGDNLSPVRDQRSYNGSNDWGRKTPHAGKTAALPAREARLPYMGGDHIMAINAFHVSSSSPMTLGHVQADAMRVVHMEMLSLTSHVLGGLHRELHPRSADSAIPFHATGCRPCGGHRCAEFRSRRPDCVDRLAGRRSAPALVAVRTTFRDD